jgi:transposase
MSDDQRKISKAKAVEICADELFQGKQTREIVRFFVEMYGVSRSAVEKWIKAAKPLVEDRRQAAREVQRKLDAETIADLAKKHKLTLEDVIIEYAKIAKSDIRNVFNDDGGLKNVKEWDDQVAGAISLVETMEITVNGQKIGDTRKLKTWDKKTALDSVCKLLGYGAQNKVEVPLEDLSSLTITFK